MDSQPKRKKTIKTPEFNGDVKYSFGYMYAYSERPGTMAERKLEDDVPFETKKRRLAEVVESQRAHSFTEQSNF